MSKYVKRMVRFLDRTIDRLLFLLFLLMFVIGFYAMYDSYRVYTDSASPDVLYYKPGYESSDGEAPAKQIQGLMAAWLTMTDTSIDYPVMQGEDNSEYLSKDPFGDYSLAGSIFLDARNSPDFSDDYSLVYGHHMEHGLMFGALDAWMEEPFFDSHRTGTLIINDETYSLTVFAVLESEATREEIFAPTEVPLSETLSYVRGKAVFIREEDWPSDGERVVGLSTCKFPDTADRTIVLCVLR